MKLDDCPVVVRNWFDAMDVKTAGRWGYLVETGCRKDKVPIIPSSVCPVERPYAIRTPSTRSSSGGVQYLHALTAGKTDRAGVYRQICDFLFESIYTTKFCVAEETVDIRDVVEC